MRVVRILQVGDVHFPQAREQTLIDLKDDGFTAALAQRACAQGLQSVVRSMIDILEEQTARPSAVLICGDLTTYGDSNEYAKCVDFLADSLRLTDKDTWLPERIHVVPGNHDVDRGRPSMETEGFFAKFAELVASWERHGLAVLSPDKVRHCEISDGDLQIDTFSLNSSIGCGEKRFLPEKIRDQIHQLLKINRSDGDITDDELKLVTEQLDTPAFDEQHIGDLTSKIRSLPAETLPVILSHHNLLPQAVVRVAMYTELLNGGLLRGRLSSMKRPILYLHGHIHDDPVEVLDSPTSNGGRLVLVSAPLLEEGFNLIEVNYAKCNRPLGCVVRRFRLQNHGGVEEIQALRVPLVTSRDVHDFSSDALKSVIAALSTNPLTTFKQIRESIHASTAKRAKEASIASTLLEAEWLGLVHIQNREQSIPNWQLRRAEP